jgi:hypothetical protein
MGPRQKVRTTSGKGEPRSPEAELIHQIGNSIGAVGLHAQVVARLAAVPPVQEHADAILREVRALSALLEELRGQLADQRPRKSSR